MSHYLKIPTMIQSSVDAHKKWMQLLTEADHLVAEDADLQRKAAKGLSLKERHMPPEVLGRLYAQYCDVINRMYDSYLSSVHLQRAPYILDIVTVIWKRLYELRQELVHVIVNDYIYVDAALFMLKKTPYDIQIVVPYHFPLESRSEGMERLLQTMWADAERRKNEPELDQTKSQLLEEDCLLFKTELSTFQSVAKIPIQDEGESTEEFIQAVIIQKHERYRKFFIEDFNAKCRKRKLYFTEKNESKAPKQLKLSAALLIQKVYRSYMRLKREKMLNYKRDVLLGILPDPARKRLVVDEANNKIYERRRKTRKDMQAKYMKEMEREKSRLVVLTRDNQIDDITEHVMEWFKEWYEGYGFFPQFPYETEGGTVMVIREDYPYIEEKIEEDEKLAQLTKGKTKEMIVVPYHFPLESRSEGMERLLQTMWADAERRKNEPELDQTKSQLLEEDCLLSKTELSTFQSVAKIPIQDEGESTEEFIQAVIIQKHERYRKFFIEDFNAKCRKRKLYFTEKNESKAPKQLKLSAALLIQKVYRSYMRLKREKMLNYKRDVLLGILPDPARKRLVVDEANNKIYERRRKTRKDMQAKYMKEMEREKSRLVVLTRDNQIDDITEHVMEWFKEWYEGYGFFPQFPYETEGGTVMVIREDYPYIEEKIEEDEKLAQLTKGKTKEMLTRERKAALEEAKMREELAKEQKLKEAEMLFKQRCNPLADPGYKPQQSQHTGNISEALQKYRAAWSIHDRFPDRTPSTVYGYLQSVLTEELMSQLHVECRKFVDELMRLDLKLLIKMQQLMYKRIGQKFPKLKPRKKPAVPKPPKPLEITDRMLQNIQVVFGLNIISKPTAKIKDIYGDLNYKAYEQNIADPNAKFPPPAYGDIRRRLTLSCVFGSGIEPGAVRNKAVMLLGPERHGKSFMVDAVCGELNAVKIDISPEVTSAVVSRPAKVLSEVLVAARVFQPAVIYMRNVERVFLKKIPPENRYLKAKKLKRPLIKLLKQMSADDKIIFIATCSNPFVSRAKPILSLFREVLLVPRTDYASLQSFFFEEFQRIRSMPRDYCVSSLAQVLQGYGFGVVLELIDKVMTAERIVRLNVTPLSQLEFLEPLIEAGIEAVTLEEYQKYTDFFIANSPLRKEREEYDIINKYRASVYEKIFKDEQKKLNA